jgi:hypothetical protein
VAIALFMKWSPRDETRFLFFKTVQVRLLAYIHHVRVSPAWLSAFCILSPSVPGSRMHAAQRDSFQARIGLLRVQRNIESSSTDWTATEARGVRCLDDDQVGVIGPEQWLLTSRLASIR